MCFMCHACSHCSLFFRQGSFLSLKRPSLLPQLPVSASTPVFKLCFWCERQENYILLLYFKIALVQLDLGSKISQIGKQYVLILVVIKNLSTSLVDGVSLLSCNMLFYSTAAFPSCSVVQVLPFAWCCIGCCVFVKCQNCVGLCLCCWYIQMFDGIITIQKQIIVKYRYKEELFFQAAGCFPCPGITDYFLALVVLSQDSSVYSSGLCPIGSKKLWDFGINSDLKISP